MRTLWRRLAIVVATILVVVLAGGLGLVAFTSYRVSVTDYSSVDDRTISVLVTGGAGTWCRDVDRTETPAEVRFGAACTKLLPLPGTAAGVRTYLTIRLHSPLGTRLVVDGSDGHIVPVAQPRPAGFE